MKVVYHLLAASLILSTLVTTGAYAGITCGQKIIDVGDDKATVREHCGEPTSGIGSRWVYDRGSTALNVVIHFGADDTINRIEEGSNE